MTWDWEFAWETLPYLLEGLKVTVLATLVSMALAMVGGLVLVLGSRSRHRHIAYACRGYVEFIRSTPLLVHLYFAYFLLPEVGVVLRPFVTGVLVLGLHYSAFLSEVYRAGIESIRSGQWDAANALNFDRFVKWRYLILPQAIRPMIPVFGNYLIYMFKETPLLSSITVIEMFQQAKIVGAVTYRYLEPFTLVGVLFLIVSVISSRLVRRLEVRFAVRT